MDKRQVEKFYYCFNNHAVEAQSSDRRLKTGNTRSLLSRRPGVGSLSPANLTNVNGVAVVSTDARADADRNEPQYHGSEFRVLAGEPDCDQWHGS